MFTYDVIWNAPPRIMLYDVTMPVRTEDVLYLVDELSAQLLDEDGRYFIDNDESAPDPTQSYLTFSNIATLAMGDGAKHWDGTLYASTDAAEWTEWDGSEIASGATNKIYLRGVGNTIITGLGPVVNRFVLTGADVNGVTCNGNIECLLDYETVLQNNHPEMGEYCFANLFRDCAVLISAPDLPASVLPNFCYEYMFLGCTKLTTAPVLPATTLADACYRSMFHDCVSLTTPPALPATSLAPYCYIDMFKNCTGLMTTPELPAISLRKYCYGGMFYGCTSLTEPTELPATGMADSCYYTMFYGCTNIKLSTASDETYNTPYRIPSTGTIDFTYGSSFSLMFGHTGGSFTGKPKANTTYYLAT